MSLLYLLALLAIAESNNAVPGSKVPRTIATAQEPEIELIYQFTPLCTPEASELRPNGQLLVSCNNANGLYQLDPTLGPDQQKRTVFTFPDGVLMTLAIDTLSPDVYIVANGQVAVDLSTPLNLSSVLGQSTSVWVVDLTEYQAPAYDNSLVKAHRVGGSNRAGLFDDVSVINSAKGLVAAADIAENNIWLVDIPNDRTTLLVETPLLDVGAAAISSNLMLDAVKYINGTLYFTATDAGTFGSVPVDPNSGAATGDVQFIYDYGPVALDKFDFGPTGNVYFTTSVSPLDAGVIRRRAGTPAGVYGSEVVVPYLATNSLVVLEKDGDCGFYLTSLLRFTVVRATVPGPC